MELQRNFAFLVVMYDKDLKDSKTLNSLMQHNIKSSSLLIVNNGPTEIKDSSYLSALSFENVFLENHVENIPLSILYNDFFERFEDTVEGFILLDDDTELTDDFFEALSNLNEEILLPKIKSYNDGVVYYPRVNRITALDNFKFLVKDFEVYSIGSGLTIPISVLKLFNLEKVTPFDTSYALYGVDSSFFKRIKVLSRKYPDLTFLSSCKINHGLSGSEKKFSDFRFQEVLWDRAITLRRYPTLFGLYLYIKCFYKCLRLFRWKYFHILLKGLITGTHPRVKKFYQCKN